MSNGFVILAQNTAKVNYIECAEVLAYSLKRCMPECSISLITNDKSNCEFFDNIIPLPYGDLVPDSEWKLENDWQVYEASPYDNTIKLEADLFVPQKIDYWFDMLSVKDVCLCTTIRDYKLQISKSKTYRRFIHENQLPDVYNAITYFNKSEFSKSFFSLVREIFINWEEFKDILKCDANEPATTDWVYSIACLMLGVENTTLPNMHQYSMVHMKQFINNTSLDDWTKELVYEFEPTLKIQTFTQRYPFHYHQKHFAKTLRENYGRI